MDMDFLITYDTMYDERSYRSDSEKEEQEDEDLDEVIPPWEMEW